MEYWSIEEHKIWKGLDPTKPTWADRGQFVFRTYDQAVEIMNEMERVSGSIMRVVRNLPENFREDGEFGDGATVHRAPEHG